MAPYQPQHAGADCANCILALDGRPLRPVPPERHSADVVALVGEAPGVNEVEEGRPFVGAAGRRQAEVLRKIGLARSSCLITNALACRPPDNDLKKLKGQLQVRNRKRKAAGKQPHPHPVICCRPRLLRELEGHDNVIALGGTALFGLTGKRASIMNLRGGPLTLRKLRDRNPDVPGDTAQWLTEPPTLYGDNPYVDYPARKVMPTFHPAAVLRELRWTTAYEVDHARALRFFRGDLTWREPTVIWQPSIRDLAAFLSVVQDGTVTAHAPGRAPGWRAAKGRPLAWDLETDRLDAMTAQIRCIQIGTSSNVQVVFFETCEHPRVRVAAGKPARSDFSLSLRREGWTDPRRFWSAQDEAVIGRILSAWLTGPSLKVGWNSNYYDTLVTESPDPIRGWTPCTPQAHTDLMAVHALVEPDHPHSLAYVASIMLDSPRWKSEHAATKAQDDLELGIYGARDTANTAAIGPRLIAALARRGLGTLAPGYQHQGTIKLSHAMQAVSRTMTRNGMRIDQEERARLQTHYKKIRDRYAGRVRAIADDPSLNLNSNEQVGRLLFTADGFGLEPMEYTDSGAPSVADSSVRALLADPYLPDQPRELLKMYRQAIKADKVLGTFLRPAAPLLEGDPRQCAHQETAAERDEALAELRRCFPLPGGDAFAGGERLTSSDRRALKRILHDLWQLPPVRTVKGGISVGNDALKEHWRRPGLDKAPRDFLTAWFRWRILADDARRLAKPAEAKEENRCILSADGRIHFGWNAIRVITGRWASSPNSQNIPRRVRSMYIPGAGYSYIYADMDQLELRVAASRWKISKYLEAFDTYRDHGGKRYTMDAHQITMHAVFGDVIWTWEGAPPPAWRFYKKWPGGSIGAYFDVQRDLSKRVCYASLYAAEALTVHDVITSAEDKNGRLVYQDLTVRQVTLMQENWRKGVPEVEVGWAAEMAAVAARGFFQSPVTGRRLVYSNGAELNAVVNNPIQEIGAGLVAGAVVRFDRRFPEGFAGPNTGLVNVCHDALLAEAPLDRAEEVRAAMQEEMTITHSSLPGVVLAAGAKTKERWEDREEGTA